MTSQAWCILQISNRRDWACCGVLCCSIRSLSAFSYSADHVTLGQGLYLDLQGLQLQLAQYSCGHQTNQLLKTQFSCHEMDTALFISLVLFTIHHRCDIRVCPICSNCLHRLYQLVLLTVVGGLVSKDSHKYIGSNQSAECVSSLIGCNAYSPGRKP